jgi:hypothetical protein
LEYRDRLLRIQNAVGLPVVESFSLSAGTALVGPFSTGVELIDRAEASVDISYEHDQNFVKNLASLLVKNVWALLFVFRPDSYTPRVTNSRKTKGGRRPSLTLLGEDNTELNLL